MKITKKLEEFYPALLPDTYVIHSEGGWHLWNDVPEAAPIYHEKIWPYVERIHWPEAKDRAAEWRKNNIHRKVVKYSISFLHPYPYMNPMGIKLRIKGNAKRPPQETNVAVFILLHQAIGRAFIANPEGKKQVCHINDDISNYLVSNLKWGTNRENHTGRRANSTLSLSSLHNIFRLNRWAKG